MEKTTPEELSLIQIIAQFFQWLKKISLSLIRFVGKLIQLSVKHWAVFLIALAVNVAGSLYLSRSAARKYKAETTLHIAFTDAAIVNEMIDQLANSLNDNKNLSLASKLDIPDSVGINIQKIKHFDVIDYLDDETANIVDFKRKHDLTDTTNVVMNNRVYLQLITKKPNQLKLVHDAMINYFNSNPYLITEFEFNIKSQVKAIELIDKEMNRIDSMATLDYFKNEKRAEIGLEGYKMVLGEQKKPIYSEDLLKLTDNRHFRQNLIDTNKQPVYTTTGFIVSGPINDRVRYLAFGLVLGVIAGMISAFVFDNRQCIKNYLLKQK